METDELETEEDEETEEPHAADKKRHKVGNTSSGQYACAESGCEKRFHKKRRLREHKRKVHTSETFKCDKCPTQFKLNCYLQKHLTALRTKGSPLYHCDEPGCQYKTPWKHSVVRHKKTHRQSDPVGERLKLIFVR